MKLISIINIYLTFFLVPCYSQADTDKPLRWYGYLYGGKMVSDNFINIPGGVLSLDYMDSKIIAIGGGRELYHFKNYLTLEGEAQVAQHVGNINHHTEINAFANIRWQPFPWDRWLDTSLAWGGGVSFASDKPQVEINDGQEADQILFYMSLEVDFILPKQKDWSVFSRIHHRSSVYGNISSADGSSNAVVAGVKKRF